MTETALYFMVGVILTLAVGAFCAFTWAIIKEYQEEKNNGDK